jgi:RHS repeat-associated protein
MTTKTEGHRQAEESGRLSTNETGFKVPDISLPKGGGAIRGIGEKFSPNPATGTAGMSFPLFSPHGRTFVPQLSLSYDSGAGSSPFGFGWHLSGPSITRKTDKGLPKYLDDDESDVFILADAEDLVPALTSSVNGWSKDVFEVTLSGSTFMVQRYRPRVEGIFARIEKISVEGELGSYWKVTTKENVVTILGRTAAARIADPHDPTRIFKWLPEWSYDDKGNCIEFVFKPEDLDQVPITLSEKNRRSGLAQFTNSYLKRIRYGNKNPYYPNATKPFDPNPPANPEYFFETVFDYGEHHQSFPTPSEVFPWKYRCDPFSDYRAGFEIRTYRLCKRILSFHYFKELNFTPSSVPDPCLVRSLDLSYKHFSFGLPQARQEADLIIAIRQVCYKRSGPSSYESRTLPALELNYHELEWNKAVKTILPEDIANAPVGLAANYQWLDLYVEGISGILSEDASGWYYKRNLGSGHFSTAKSVAPKPSLLGAARGALQFHDLNADGNRQVVINETGLKGYFQLSDDDQWLAFFPFEQMPAVSFTDPNTRFADLSGDGRPDLVISEDQSFRWYPSRGTRGYDASELAPKPFDEEKGPAVIFADAAQSIYLADMSGDGLTDIARIRNGEVCYWPNLGYGKFGAKVTMENAPLFDRPEQFNPSYLHLADISGTGATDILYLGRNKFKAWLNLAGNALSDAQEMDPFPTLELPNQLSVVDLLGNGTACIVWSSPLPQYAGAPMRYVDLMGGKKPYILSAYKNNLGAEIEIEYKSSTQFFLEDKKAGQPWITKLPFPVHCLSKMETRDTVSDLYFVNEYRYHHGYYDHAEREFRGFGMVEQVDTQSFEHFQKSGATNIVSAPLHQPPVLTKTWFHNGAFIRHGNILRQFEHEYHQNGAFAEHHLADAEIEAAELTSDELRQAYRACKGTMLRQEVYALDDSAAAGHPYSVAQHNCHIRLLQPALSGRHAVFLVHESEAITYQYERNLSDPRVSHTLNTVIGEYGNVLESAAVAYRRANVDTTLRAEVQTEQSKTHITYTKNNYTRDVSSNTAYRLRLPCETQTFELTGVAPARSYFTPGELLRAFGNAVSINYDVQPTNTSIQVRLIEHGRTLFARNNDLGTPLTLGLLESLGLKYETYLLAFTPSLLTHLYDTRVSDAMLTEGKYVKGNDYKTNGRFPNSDPDGQWWTPSGFVLYPADPARHFYLPDRYIDPFGGRTRVEFYSDYHLLIEETEDALGNKTSVRNFDFRFLAPQAIRDINDNISEISFDILGLVAGAATMGKGNEADDLIGFNPDPAPTEIVAFFNDPKGHGAALLQNASSRVVYDLAATPACAATITRETHQQVAVASGITSKLQFAFEYSNGIGQVAMKKVQAEPGKAKKGELHSDGTYTVTEVDTTPELRWVGTGRTVLNNKGKAVMQYEPYFSVTHGYENAAELVAVGVTPVMYYDPVGRLIRTDLPNGTFSKVEFDAWQQRTFDQNDTVQASDWFAVRAGGATDATEQDAARKASLHHDTPSVAYLDSLGRTFYTIAHNRFRNRVTTLIRNEFYATQVELDIEGNQRRIVDARGNPVMQSRYDLLGHQVYQESMDSGERWLLNDSMGKALYGWDRRNRFHTNYDALHRPTEHEVLTPAAVTIVYEKFEYGADKTKNQNGKLVASHDGSGVLTNAEFDFKGNTLEMIRRFTQVDDARPNWSDIAAVTMQPESFTTTTRFDALSRPIEVITPDHSRTLHEYKESNLLDKIRVSLRGAAATDFVTNIDYDAKGQRQKIEYGNRTVTTYDYDPLTFRLQHLITSRTTDNVRLQDLNYTHDPVGNVTQIRDLAPQTIYFNNQRVLAHQDFTYDALYRLLAATGREHAGSDAPVSEFDEFRTRLSHKGQDEALQNYLQQYDYDAVGNMTMMVHAAGIGSFTNRWTRELTPKHANNQLASTTIGSTTITYQYDDHGNMIRMPHLDAMNWDFNDHLESVNLRGGGMAYYFYDAAGNRARKVIKRLDGLVEERLYVGAFEVFTSTQGGHVQLRRESLHIMDDTRRIAMIDTRTDAGGAMLAQLIRYQYGNHLGSAALELDDGPLIISYEEYYPFGSTSYQAVDKTREVPVKRYRYTSKERDEESGFYYHGARYYAPWLARWTAADPNGVSDGVNVYAYVSNNPVRLHDPTGTDGVYDETAGVCRPEYPTCSPTNASTSVTSVAPANSVRVSPTATQAAAPQAAPAPAAPPQAAAPSVDPWYRFSYPAFYYQAGEHSVFQPIYRNETGNIALNIPANMWLTVSNLCTIPINTVSELAALPDRAILATGGSQQDVEAWHFASMMVGVGEINYLGAAARASQVQTELRVAATAARAEMIRTEAAVVLSEASALSGGAAELRLATNLRSTIELGHNAGGGRIGSVVEGFHQVAAEGATFRNPTGTLAYQGEVLRGGFPTEVAAFDFQRASRGGYNVLTVNASPESAARAIAWGRILEGNPQLLGPYSPFTNSCTTVTRELLQVGGMAPPFWARSPALLQFWFRMQGGQ